MSVVLIPNELQKILIKKIIACHYSYKNDHCRIVKKKRKDRLDFHKIVRFITFLFFSTIDMYINDNRKSARVNVECNQIEEKTRNKTTKYIVIFSLILLFFFSSLFDSRIFGLFLLRHV